MKKAQGVIEKSGEYFAYASVLEALSQGLYPDRITYLARICSKRLRRTRAC